MLRQIMSSLRLLLFNIFPKTLIYGLKCGSGGTCYRFKDIGTPFALKEKECADACVSFKCFIDDGEVMEGADRYNDFLNTCKYTRTEIKDTIKKNIKQSAMHEFDVYITSCNDIDGCATNGLTGPWIINNSTDETFGKFSNAKPGLPCKFDNKAIKHLSQVECKSTINCESGKEHGYKLYNYAIYGQKKICDACIKFTCTPDGKTVTSGYGCYQDSEEACKFLNDDDIKGKVQQNIKDSFYYDKNYIVCSCSDSDNCQIWSTSLNYSKVAETVLTVDLNSDKTCVNEITSTSHEITTTSPQIVTTTLPPQIEITTSKNSGQTFASTLPQNKTDPTKCFRRFYNNQSFSI